MNHKKQNLIHTALIGLALLASPLLQAESEGYCINFNDVPVIEFIRFVSRISEENFIFDNKELNFSITLSTGKPVSTEHIVKALIQLLKTQGFDAVKDDGYYVIHKIEEGKLPNPPIPPPEQLIASEELLPPPRETYEFGVYKLQYHEGNEIQEALKRIGADMRSRPDCPMKMIEAIQSIQWVKATNSLLYSGDAETVQALRTLIASVDTALRQVFIEVLVIETDVKKSLDFGLQWAAGGTINGKVGFGTGSFAPGRHSANFAEVMQKGGGPSGISQFPLLPGFDLGVIGDIITHKGRTFLSLGSLVSALQVDGDSTIVLNQKIITQDNKNSTIFVGDNIPFTGSIVQTVGQSQQTTANIEYRDVGVSLSITPRMGEGDVITLDIEESITESLEDPMGNSTTNVNGIRTTKTNMATHVHVPDKHFLVLSGMIRNRKSHHKGGIPCLGGLPWIGAAFSKTRKEEEKRNVIIFVRPHLINSFEDYNRLTQAQSAIHQAQASGDSYQEGVKMVEEREE